MSVKRPQLERQGIPSRGNSPLQHRLGKWFPKQRFWDASALSGPRFIVRDRPASASTGHGPALFHAVIRRFLGNDHVVNVAFAQPRWGDSQETRFPLQLADVARAAISHA